MAATRRPEYRRFLARLRAAREHAGLTQVQVSKRLRVPQSFVSKCESGERRVDVVELMAFARLYRKPIGHFVDHRTA
jgi:transcriptional regulator with XRE-family HTH domain